MQPPFPIKGVLRSKQQGRVGEPPKILSYSAFAATRAAIASAREGLGLAPWDFVFDVPATPDRVQRACGFTASQLGY